MTDGERQRACSGRSAEWWRALALHLTGRLRSIGDHLDLHCFPEGDGGDGDE